MRYNQILKIANLITEDPNVFMDYRIFVETYERGAHPSTQQFWSGIRQSRHPFSVHPILAMYGNESAQKSYEHTVNALQQAFPELQNASPEQIQRQLPDMAMRIFTNISRLEAPHRRELEELAKELVHRTWGIPTEMMDARLGPPELKDEDDSEAELEDMDIEEVPVDRDQVNKRITMNALTQGAAVHNMATIHYAAEQELSDIDPKLLHAYKKFSGGAVHGYWLIDFAEMTREMLSTTAVGSSKVSYGQADSGADEFGLDDDEEFELDDEALMQSIGNAKGTPEEPAAPQAKIIARAANFPILVQELVKGTMELLSFHGLEGLDRKQLEAIYQESDRMEDEPWFIQVGPHIWRAFLKIVPKGHDLASVVAEVAAQPPKWIHNLLSQTIEAVHRGEDPAEARAALEELMESANEEPGWSPEEDTGEWEPEEEQGEWSPEQEEERWDDEDDEGDWRARTR